LKEQTAGILQVVGFAISRQDGIIGKNVFVGNFVEHVVCRSDFIALRVEFYEVV
jgi:hypothetical protein